MLAGNPNRRFRSDVSRRDLLVAGALGGLGFCLPATNRAALGEQPRAEATFGRAKRAVLLFLTGGPPQHDTWDMKPDAPAQIRGELKPIATSVPGIQIGELFPRLASRIDKLRIVRSVTHGDTVHNSAGYTMLTGAVHPEANSGGASMIRPTPDDLPPLGSWLARAREAEGGLPFVAMPEVIKDANVNTFPGQEAGVLGPRYSPLCIEANNERTGFRVPPIVLPANVPLGRLADRRQLSRLLTDQWNGLEADAAAAALAAHRERAADLLADAPVANAFALDREPANIRESYGTHLFGQGCLLARRLLEAGVGLVTVYWHYEGPDDSPVWDTHWNNFKHLRERLAPPTDLALSALLDDLAARGLLEDTLVICLGEFGRSPKINGKAGRDHWPRVQSILLAGAGIPGGTVYGASDRDGADPLEKAIAPPNLTATFLHLLGVPPNLEVHDRVGRPFRAYAAAPIAELVT